VHRWMQQVLGEITSLDTMSHIYEWQWEGNVCNIEGGGGGGVLGVGQPIYFLWIILCQKRNVDV
jgi:hypothetical protein